MMLTIYSYRNWINLVVWVIHRYLVDLVQLLSPYHFFLYCIEER